MAIRLTIDNSYSRVEGLSPKQFNDLRKLLSYKVDVYGSFPRTVYCIDKKGYFPSGLLKRVKSYLDTFDILGPVYTTLDSRTRPSFGPPQKWKASNPIPYPWQTQGLIKVGSNPRGIMSAVTGSGKSLLIALIASRLNVRTLVIVPTLELKRQLKAALNEFMEDSSIVTVENIDSKRLQSLKNYDCIIIDEAHHVAAKTYRTLNRKVWNSIYYRFCLTATPFRNNSDEQLLFEGIAGQVIYRYDYGAAVTDRTIVPIEAYYVDLPKIETTANTWAAVYNQLVVNNEYRNQVIANLMIKLESASKSTLCLVKEIKHGEAIQHASGANFANGQDANSIRFIADFSNGRIENLVATTAFCGEGVDTRAAEYIIIAGLGKAKSAFMQQVGRGVRRYKDKESCKIILFRDKSHKWLLKHYREQVKILKDEYGVIPIKLEL